MKPRTPPPPSHPWVFRPRFRRHAFGWKSQPAIARIKEAVAEIKKVARKEPALAAEGAVLLLERISPAIEQVDGSSGSIGTAVNRAIDTLVPIIASASADAKTREHWLERLWNAHEADGIPYIETLADYWGDLCASKEVASAWADRLIGVTRMALSPDKTLRGHFHGTSACLSALHRAGRYEEIIDILHTDTIWPYKRWAVKALAAMGHTSEAIRYAESCRGPWTNDGDLFQLCEEILLAAGQIEEAYERYGLSVMRGGTYLAAFRAAAKTYPHKSAGQILAGLVANTPGDEGKWFAAAKDAGLYDEALELARAAPCDPRTLTRAARDLATRQPAFAVAAGLLALHWLAAGYGYEITVGEVWAAYQSTMAAAEKNGSVAETRERVREIVAGQAPGGLVASLRGELGL